MKRHVKKGNSLTKEPWVSKLWMSSPILSNREGAHDHKRNLLPKIISADAPASSTSAGSAGAIGAKQTQVAPPAKAPPRTGGSVAKSTTRQH